MGDWSRQFEQTYHVIAPDDLRVWLDDGLWRESLGAEFCQPLTPEQMLAPTREQIWAGLTPPDALPIIGNNYGDWLCLRFDLDNTVSEVIRWSHAGGDWIPYGKSLSEALLFDAALRVTTPRRPEFIDPEPPDEQLFGAAEWAWAQLDAPRREAIEAFWRSPQRDAWTPTTLFQKMAEADLCVVPCATELALLALDNPLKQGASPKLAHAMDQSWEPDFVQWMMDGGLLPDKIADDLAAQWDTTPDELRQQDWGAAERWALTVLEQRSDIAWAGDIAGWAAERRGDQQSAAQRYTQVCQASTFTDDAIRFRTQWYPSRFAKFSVFRLDDLPKTCGTGEGEAYLEMATQSTPLTLRADVANFWRETAANAAKSGEHARQCRSLIGAGWDIGLDDFGAYESLLDEIQGAAERCGALALAALTRAQIHAS